MFPLESETRLDMEEKGYCGAGSGNDGATKSVPARVVMVCARKGGIVANASPSAASTTCSAGPWPRPSEKSLIIAVENNNQCTPRGRGLRSRGPLFADRN